jgi:hypothetical protein
MELITLRAGSAGLTVAPAVGGAVTRYWLERDGTTWEWLRPTPPEALCDAFPYRTAAFPLVPFPIASARAASRFAAAPSRCR